MAMEWQSTTSFKAVWNMVSLDSILVLFDPHRQLKWVLMCLHKNYRLNAVLTQQQPSGKRKPISYIFKSLTTTDQHHAKIKKEAQVVTWKFCIYIDHKPLLTLLTTKGLDELPVRIQRFCLWLMCFSYTVSQIPGKDLAVVHTNRP